jgi:hypothetical protein
MMGSKDAKRLGARTGPVIALLFVLFVSCSQDGGGFHLPIGDIRPPSILDAGQTESGFFRIVFDEEVEAVEGSYAFTPAGSRLEPRAEGSTLEIGISPAAPAGQDCAISGEARDASGNICRFLFGFAAYNASPATLVITEIQTGKNASISSPHRDYLEFLATGAGNLGGICVQWASTVKLMQYMFPNCEVAAGEVIVLHCAPEGLPGEINELGDDTNLSAGVDASSEGRDFWTNSGGLPDETGAIATRSRLGDAPTDGFAYTGAGKTGELAEGKLSALAAELAEAALWKFSDPMRWEDFFQWKSSSSRPLHRKLGVSRGLEQWYVGESGTQSPGCAEPGVAKRTGRKAGT